MRAAQHVGKLAEVAVEHNDKAGTLDGEQTSVVMSLAVLIVAARISPLFCIPSSPMDAFSPPSSPSCIRNATTLFQAAACSVVLFLDSSSVINTFTQASRSGRESRSPNQMRSVDDVIIILIRSRRPARRDRTRRALGVSRASSNDHQEHGHHGEPQAQRKRDKPKSACQLHCRSTNRGFCSERGCATTFARISGPSQT